MKIRSIKACDFLSYEELQLNQFDSLNIIHGATGSGKSTIADLPCWVLFGTTPKNVSVNNMKRWGGDGFTTGTIEVEHDGNTYEITRTRNGNKGDLYFSNGTKEVIRGKDINDTQKLINEKFNLSYEKYLLGAYSSEFSLAGSFFLQTAKRRREIFQEITDISFPLELQEKTKAHVKNLKERIREVEIKQVKFEEREASALSQRKKLELLEGSFDKGTKEFIETAQHNYDNFETEKAAKIAALENRIEAWFKNRDIEHNKIIDKIRDKKSKYKNVDPFKIQVLEDHIDELESSQCKECGAPNRYEEIKAARKELNELNLLQKHNENVAKEITYLEQQEQQLCETDCPIIEQLEAANQMENTYLGVLEQAKKRINPYTEQLKEVENLILEAQTSLAEISTEMAELKTMQKSLDTIQTLCSSMRGVLLVNKINEVQVYMNEALGKYFDSEFNVKLEWDGGDNLNTTISKDGNNCDYAQLSKGQRGILKLCFVTAVMRCVNTNSHGSFKNLFFDEALDGLDVELKLKAFNLFSDLSKTVDSIHVIDHSHEFRNLFDNVYRVEIKDNTSVIVKE